MQYILSSTEYHDLKKMADNARRITRFGSFLARSYIDDSDQYISLTIDKKDIPKEIEQMITIAIKIQESDKLDRDRV